MDSRRSLQVLASVNDLRFQGLLNGRAEATSDAARPHRSVPFSRSSRPCHWLNLARINTPDAINDGTARPPVPCRWDNRLRPQLEASRNGRRLPFGCSRRAALNWCRPPEPHRCGRVRSTSHGENQPARCGVSHTGIGRYAIYSSATRPETPARGLPSIQDALSVDRDRDWFSSREPDDVCGVAPACRRRRVAN